MAGLKTPLAVGPAATALLAAAAMGLATARAQGQVPAQASPPASVAAPGADPPDVPAPAEDLTLPPRISAEPGEVRLEPAPEEREDVLEAVVTGGQTGWRLPDLGGSFREEEARDPNQRIELTLIPLFDPENQDPLDEIFPTIEDLRRVGFLRIFELRFGDPDRD